MNIRLLKKIRAAILRHPTQVNMNAWFTRRRLTRQAWAFKKPEGCGTAGCIAGWAVFLNYKAKHPNATLEQARATSAHTHADAAKLLGLSYSDSKNLFFPAAWPTQFMRELHSSKTPKQYAKVVADRITQFIQTNGEE